MDLLYEDLASGALEICEVTIRYTYQLCLSLPLSVSVCPSFPPSPFSSHTMETVKRIEMSRE